VGITSGVDNYVDVITKEKNNAFGLLNIVKK